MKPVEFEGQNVVYAKDQPEYNPLPAYKDTDGTVTTCWELTPEELEEVKKSGKIWLSQMTFNRPLQPVNMFTNLVLLDIKEIIKNDIKE